MTDSIFLAQLLGLFLIIVGLGTISNKDAFKKMIKELSSSSISLYLSGMIELVFGLYIVLHVHNFNTIYESIITLLGAGAIMEATYYLIFPKTVKLFAKKSKKFTKHLLPIGVLIMFLGVYLAYVGFGISL